MNQQLRKAKQKGNIQRLRFMIEDAAPVMAVLAFKGGSVFAKKWLDDARELGLRVPNADTKFIVEEKTDDEGSTQVGGDAPNVV